MKHEAHQTTPELGTQPRVNLPEVRFCSFQVGKIIGRFKVLACANGEDIKKTAIPEWLSVQGDLQPIVKIDVDAPVLQRGKHLGSPAYIWLPIACRGVSEDTRNDFEAGALTSIKLFCPLLPVQDGFVECGSGLLLWVLE